MTRSSSMTSRSVLRCLAPRLPALSIDFGSVFCSMPLGRIAGRPVTPLSLAISARSSATACFSAAFSASRRSVSASRSPRDSSERGIFSGTDMPGTNRVRKERMQPHSASYLPGLLPQVQLDPAAVRDLLVGFRNSYRGQLDSQAQSEKKELREQIRASYSSESP